MCGASKALIHSLSGAAQPQCKGYLLRDVGCGCCLHDLACAREGLSMMVVQGFHARRLANAVSNKGTCNTNTQTHTQTRSMAV